MIRLFKLALLKNSVDNYQKRKKINGFDDEMCLCLSVENPLKNDTPQKPSTLFLNRAFKLRPSTQADPKTHNESSPVNSMPS